MLGSFDIACLLPGAKDKIMPVFNEAPMHGGIWGEWRYISSHSQNLEVRKR
jgi:hypothetical protein